MSNSWLDANGKKIKVGDIITNPYNSVCPQKVVELNGDLAFQSTLNPEKIYPFKKSNRISEFWFVSDEK